MPEIAHIVLLAFKHDVEPDTIQGLLDDIRRYEDIDGVLRVDTSDHVTLGGEPSPYTHGVIIEFADAGARDRYLPHPAHRAVVERLDPLLEHKLVLDIATCFGHRAWSEPFSCEGRLASIGSGGGDVNKQQTPSRLAMSARTRLAVTGLSKTFPGTRALDGVDLDVCEGEIHALVGGNGSGKSTLIKILTGVYEADGGARVVINGEAIAAEDITPEFARRVGIHVVHQDLGVFLDLSVTENLALGHGYDTRSARNIDWRAMRRRAQELIDRFEIDAAPDTCLNAMSQGGRTQVAIARALQGQSEDKAGVLILDEPTAALPRHEVELLMRHLRVYAARGEAILYVSHRLDEVLALADRVTVLRDGRNIGAFAAADLTEDRLAELIVGQSVDAAFPAPPPIADRSPMLCVERLEAGPLRDVSFTVARGEVLGIAGLLGSGRSELLRAIFGDLRITSGELRLEGERYAPKRPLDAMRAGIALVPEDRAGDAAFTDLSLAANVSMANVSDYWKAGVLRDRRMRRDARALMAEHFVKFGTADAPLQTLSGGNQQKVILARWLRRRPRLMLLDEPTQGVDVGARTEIYGLVRRAVADGASAIVVASDVEELSHVCDRVLFLAHGSINGELSAGALQPDRLIQKIFQTAGERS
jgi:ribose transport system ATP-binding protein